MRKDTKAPPRGKSIGKVAEEEEEKETRKAEETAGIVWELWGIDTPMSRLARFSEKEMEAFKRLAKEREREGGRLQE